jgi:hypothetical protein
VGWRSVRKGTDQRSRAEKGGAQRLRYARIGVRGMRTRPVLRVPDLRLTGDPQPNHGVHVAAEKASIERVQVPSCQWPDAGT